MNDYLLDDVKSVNYDNIALHARLTDKHIAAMKKLFSQQPDKKIEKDAFREALLVIANIALDDDEFEELFLKLDFKRSLTDVSLEEFLTYLLLGFRSQDLEKYSGRLESPIKNVPKEFKSQHRFPINRILFVPEMTQDRTIDYLLGNYITCSRDGLINYWSIDIEKKRSRISISPVLKIQSTWVTDIAVMPDLEALCTSSTERDLRFYDVAAKKFDLRITVISLPFFINVMHYNFYVDSEKSSKLLLGDSGGKVYLVTIISKHRGPFKNKLQNVGLTVTFQQFLKGAVPMMTVHAIPTLHTDWVAQVAYYESIHCCVSISRCSKQSMLIYNMKGKESCYTFKVTKGFSCFAIAQTVHLVATGSPDGLVRIWNPFVTARSTTVFRGHHSGIISVILQDDHRILISLDEDKCIKVWDVLEQICLQTFLGLPVKLNKVGMCTYYNPRSRQVLIASNIIVTFQVYPLLDGIYTDGISHSKEVSVVLYNKLFKVVVTCGYDSFIIVWNPFAGKRRKIIRDAHTKTMHAETVPVEITAAAFDPAEQFLVTGASNGTLKVWNFNTGVCRRNMIIPKAVEVCAIVWIENRILVMGENRIVTEFADDEEVGSSSYKCWMNRHLEDILCAVANVPQILVTGSYGGEIIFWRLETGQAYSMFNVLNPSERIQSQYIRARSRSQLKGSRGSRGFAHRKNRFSNTNPLLTSMYTLKRFTKDSMGAHDDENRISINALTFLTTRKMSPNIGTVLAALDNGNIQIWSHHPAGGFIAEYKAVHAPKDYVISMCTDAENNYLFTGHMGGYIKVWHMINFGMPEEDQVHVCMPLLRLKFPFLLKDVLLGRAKRAHRVSKPILLNSFQVHLKATTGVLYVDSNQMIISCSSDASSRLWTLSGRYMGTLGTFKPWTYVHPERPADETREYTMPADILRSCSFTTFKVLNGGKDARYLAKTRRELEKKTTKETDPTKLFGPHFTKEDILGKHFKLPIRYRTHYHFLRDYEIGKKIPVFINVDLPELTTITQIPTPELITEIHKQQAAITKRKQAAITKKKS